LTIQKWQKARLDLAASPPQWDSGWPFGSTLFLFRSGTSICIILSKLCKCWI